MTGPCATSSHDAYRRLEIWPSGESGNTATAQDEVAIEQAVALEYNGISHAVMLATPADLEDLAWGFSFTEGIVRRPGDIYDIDIERQEEGIVIRLTIASACLHGLKQRRRQMAGRTGCGLCGLDSLSQVRRTLAPVASPDVALPVPSVLAATQALFARQALHQLTGATHGAGLADAAGELLAVREDVGRHNALDKLIGHMLRQDLSAHNSLAIISSRASFEMVQKAAAAGIAVLAAVSAPTTYAIETAHALNIALAGFVRQQRFNIYSHPEHLIRQAPDYFFSCGETR